MDHVALALGLTLLAGLSTGFGSLIALVARRTSTRLLSVAMGFSAGVMIYVSFTEILGEAHHRMALAHGEGAAAWLVPGTFFGGVLVIAVIDRLVPEPGNPHEPRAVEDEPIDEERRLARMGLLTAVAIAIHNFPEGIATFAATLADPMVGIPIAVAIAIHNVPEGIAVAMPIYYATGSRKKAFWYSFLSGLSEPLGAVIGYLVLRPFFTDGVMGALLGSIAGVMVFISLDELLPAAREYGQAHLAIYGTMAGMAVMALSLALLA